MTVCCTSSYSDIGSKHLEKLCLYSLLTRVDVCMYVNSTLAVLNLRLHCHTFCYQVSCIVRIVVLWPVAPTDAKQCKMEANLQFSYTTLYHMLVHYTFDIHKLVNITPHVTIHNDGFSLHACAAGTVWTSAWRLIGLCQQMYVIGSMDVTRC